MSELMISKAVLEGILASLLTCLAFGLGLIMVTFLVFVIYPWIRDELKLWWRERG